jgi:hypothetical protein
MQDWAGRLIGLSTLALLLILGGRQDAKINTLIDQVCSISVDQSPPPEGETFQECEKRLR